MPAGEVSPANVGARCALTGDSAIRRASAMCASARPSGSTRESCTNASVMIAAADGPDFAKFRNRDYYIFGWPVLIGGICDRNLAALEVRLRPCHRCKQTRQRSARHTSEYSMHRPPRVKPNALAAALSAHPSIHRRRTERSHGRSQERREHYGGYGIAWQVRLARSSPTQSLVLEFSVR